MGTQLRTTTERYTYRTVLAAAMLVAPPTVASTAELPEGTTLLDSDIVWDIDPDVISEVPDPSSFVISPDDQSIAYISKGALWKCGVTAGPPIKLADLPNTKTAFLAMPEYRAAWSAITQRGNITDHHIFLGRLSRDMVGVCSLAWTSSQDGLVYGLRQHWQSNAETALHKVMHLSTDGSVTTLATIARDRGEEPHEISKFHVTRDKKFVIASAGYAPLIWDTASNKPRATCFDVLLPSSTTGRFLGIEIDTRQLVIADENFEITKRLDVTFESHRFCDLVWSPDERFAICRTRLKHPSEKWTGFRVNLETGEQRPLDGSFMAERWAFTGRDGEAVRAGKTHDFFGVYADGGGAGTSISIVPDGKGEQRDIIRFQRPRDGHFEYSQKAGRYPPVRLSRNGKLFALAIPREGGEPGYRYFLVDRSGDKWRFAPDDKVSRVSPYHVIAIANNGQTIVAYDDTRLFSIPVATIKYENAK